MVEIALCIAIIGFALVAIIGVLPTAMRVQQDNRGDTLIDQDANYLMEAIRHGAQGMDDLENYVIKPTVRYVYTDSNNNSVTNYVDKKNYDTGLKLIGVLSAPRTNNDNYRVEAGFRAISGAAVEKDTNSPISFQYLLATEVIPFSAFDSSTAFGASDPAAIPNMARNLRNDLYDLRLTFRWPLSPNGRVGNNKKTYRTLVSGNLGVIQIGDYPYFLFQPTTFIPTP